MQPDRLIFHLQQKLTQLIVKAGFDHHARFALGCSGGVDSTVLAFAAHAWAVETGRHLYALVVDHRIQPDSASRAQASLKRLHAMGLEAYGLCPPERPASSSQRSARMIRFGLLQGWCVEKRITGLVLAHHGDDQIETFALRLEARSRACGLA
ncbi:MAG: ATP-binding protein, partial [Pseudomonadota bacterium]